MRTQGTKQEPNDMKEKIGGDRPASSALQMTCSKKAFKKAYLNKEHQSGDTGTMTEIMMDEIHHCPAQSQSPPYIANTTLSNFDE